MPRSLGFAPVLVLFVTLAGEAQAFDAFKELRGAPLGSASEWTNYIRLDDLDGDGDLDVLVPNCGGFFSSPAAQPFRVYKNDGKAKFTEAPEMFGGAFNAAIRVLDVGDIDGDGDLDVFAPSASGAADRLFVNHGKGVFVDEASARIGSHSRSAAVRFLDVDADGDLDVFVAAGYAASEPVPARLYVNDGQGTFGEALGKLPNVGPSEIDDVDVFDADRDFDLDLLVNSHGEKPVLWLNDGTGTFVDAKAALGFSGAGLKYGPSACDVDGDGDLDLWFDNAGPDYTEALLINDGKGTFVDETVARVSGNPSADDNGVVCADVDLDGDFDAIVVSLGTPERVLLNDGSGHFTHVGGFPKDVDSSLWLDVGDLDGDGRLDAVTGQGESGNLMNRVYLGFADNPVDVRVPAVVLGPLPASLAEGQTVAVRFRVADRVLVDAGPRVRAELQVTVDGGAVLTEPAHFVGGDLYQVNLKAPAGSSMLLRACATDPKGNTGCSQNAVVSDSGGATSSASTGAGGESNVASATGSGGNGSSVSAGSAGSDVGADDGGCSCRSVGGRERPVGWLSFGLCVTALAVCRRSSFSRRAAV